MRARASARLELLIAVAALGALAGVRAAASELVAAAERHDAAAVLAALERGADPSERSPDGTTALHWAAYHEDEDLVARLIAAGADVEAVNHFGSTPLAEAASTGNANIVRMLVDAGADVNARGKDGQTPLMVVARTNGVEAARILIEAGADVNARETWRDQTAVIWAAARGQAEMVKLLVEHGADPNARSRPTDWQRQVSQERRRLFRPFGGLTALMYAAREGCVECARALVEGGADPDLSGYRNMTPLTMAIDNFHFDVAAYLIDAGASLDIWDWWGRTPLYMAVDMNTLSPAGRPDLRSTDETTALDLVEKILAKGANPNVQLKLFPPFRESSDRGCDTMLTTGTTPLLRAAKTFDVASMRLLLAHGARLDLPNQDGVTPLMAAAGYGSVECDIRGYGPGIPHYLTPDVQQASIEALKVLIEAGADVNAATTGGGRRGRGPGQTALFGAAFWGWNDVVRFLVDNGARIDAVDAEGRTAVDAALGRAGGHERGSSILVFEETAELLKTLCRERPDCDIGKLERPTS
ncbi:MAG TPA: ankyrin repeat domain-containing protein [Gammaproteobacteria bacterium]